MTRGTRPLKDRTPPLPTGLRHLRWPIRLTRAGLVAERATRCFWPALSVLLAALAPLMFGWHEIAPVEVLWAAGVVAVLGFLAALMWGLWRFRWPSQAEAVARVDAALPGRPISTLADQQAIGVEDEASREVWLAHLARMSARTREARAVEPDLRVSNADPFGLRYMALLFFVVALLFGSIWRVGTVGTAVTGGAAVVATGPVWEGWIEPPAYTGKPSLYLADLPEGRIDIPVGSEITLRLYGEVGALTVSETVSGRTEDIPSAAEAQQSFLVAQEGTLSIEGEGGASWDIRLVPDAGPTVELSGPIQVEAFGEMAQPFRATDDYAVVAGRATITLDLSAVDRRHGLSVDPDPRDPIVIDLPMPFTGARDDFTESLIDDFSQDVWSNLPVTLTLTVADAAGQEGATEPESITLPGRRFFQPVARAIIEQRRDFLWSKANAQRVEQILRTFAHRPEDIFPNEANYLRLSFIIRELTRHNDEDSLTDEVQAELSAAMWDLAIQLEDGSLADARARLARAQERLDEAMRNGASDEEIAELMQELREAMDDYMRMLAEQSPQQGDGTDQPQAGDTMEITRDELQALMDRIQELMEEGRMAEAAELMEQLNQLMENLQVTQNPNGQGGPGEQSMQDLSETLRDQQDLSDEAFRDLQDQFNGRQGQQPEGGDQQGQQGQQQGQQGQQEGQGQSPGDDPNSPGGGTGEDGQGGEGQQGTLADRQQALRDELNRQRGNLPNLDGEAAEQAGRALDRADEAMDGAEQALREGDLAEAIDRQAEAMDALRDGLRNLGEALAENRSEQQPGQGTQQGNAEGRLEPTRRDPLGRELGNSGQMGTEENLLQGQDIYRRAEELLGEIRRRAAEQERPELELDYLKRLLERF